MQPASPSFASSPTHRTMHRPFLPKPSTASNRPANCFCFIFGVRGVVIAPLSKRSWRGRMGTGGGLRNNNKEGVEILYLGCTCVRWWGETIANISFRLLFSSLAVAPLRSPPSRTPQPKLSTALSADAAPCCLPCGEYKQIILGSLSGRHQLCWRPQNAHRACVYRVEGRP